MEFNSELSEIYDYRVNFNDSDSDIDDTNAAVYYDLFLVLKYQFIRFTLIIRVINERFKCCVLTFDKAIELGFLHRMHLCKQIDYRKTSNA